MGNLQVKVIEKKLKQLNDNKNVRFYYEMKENKKGVLPFEVIGKNEGGTILFVKCFENIKEVYFYILGLLYVLEGGVL